MEYSILQTHETQKTYDWTQPFVLTLDDLQRLCDALQSLVGSISFEAQCADAQTREFSSLAELLRFENPPKKAMEEIWLKGFSGEKAMKLALHFDTKVSTYLAADEGNIFLRVEGTAQNIVLIQQLIDDHLPGMRPWYHLIAAFSILRMRLLLLGIWLWFLIAYGLSRAVDEATLIVERILVRSPSVVAYLPSERIASVLGFVLFLVIPIIILLLLAKILNWIREGVFPTGVIALGQGAKRYEHKEILRTVIILAFLVSLLASLVAPWFLTQESKPRSPTGAASFRTTVGYTPTLGAQTGPWGFIGT